MIELFRQYWWGAVLLAALVVVATHAGLVKLVAVLQARDAAARRQEGGDGRGPADSGRGGGPLR